jgi:hypothetical protein
VCGPPGSMVARPPTDELYDMSVGSCLRWWCCIPNAVAVQHVRFVGMALAVS